MIEPKGELFTKEHLKRIGIESVSMIDVLNCFPSRGNSNNQPFYDRSLHEGKSWWSNFFEHLSKNMTKELADTMFLKPIFILNETKSRQYVPSDIDGSRVLLFINVGQSIKMWKKNVILLFHESDSEQSALLQTNEVNLLTEDELIKLILLEHLAMATSPAQYKLDNQSREELWQDLNFLRSYTDRFDCSKPLMTPIQDSQFPCLVSEATLPTVLGLDIRKYVLDQSYPFIDLPSNIGELELLFDLLRWEKFLLTLNCRVPFIELKNYSVKDLPVIRILEKCQTTEYAEIGEYILSKQEHKTREVLSQFPIVANIFDRQEIFPISTTFEKSLVRDSHSLPWVNIRSSYRTLANILGIHVKYDIQTCVTILNFLAEKNETDIKLYLTCLRYLQLELRSDDANIDLDSLRTSCCLYLPDEKQFFPLAELFILSEYNDEYFGVVKQCCKYLDLKFISPEENQVNWEFKELFSILKCKSFLTISDVGLAISRASRDTRNFLPHGDGITVLNDGGRNLIINLFQYLEYVILETTKRMQRDSIWYQVVIEEKNPKACIGSRDDLEWRFKLSEIPNSINLEIMNEIKKASIPILTIRNELIEIANRNIIYSCFETGIIQYSLRLCPRIHFVSPTIVRACPLVLAVCGIDYIERVGKIQWLHKENDQEEIHDELTKIFQRVMEDDKIQVVSVPYGFMRPILPPELVSNNISEEHSRGQKRITSSLWIIKSFVLLCIGHEKNDSLKTRLAISALATLLHHRKYVSYKDAERTARDEILACSSFQPNGIWHLACGGDVEYRYTEVIFPADRLSNDAINRRHADSSVMVSNSDEESNVVLIAADRLEIDINYCSRVKTSDHKSTSKIGRNVPSNYYVFDSEELSRIGLNAEHFFFRYLQNQYKSCSVFSIENWTSSARLKVYPTYQHGINDAAGYDFSLKDTKEFFAKGKGVTTKTCYFEVKGTGGPFDSKATYFNLSQNEYDFCSNIFNNEDRRTSEAYFVVIIEYCLDNDRIDIGKLIYWYAKISVSLAKKLK